MFWEMLIEGGLSRGSRQIYLMFLMWNAKIIRKMKKHSIFVSSVWVKREKIDINSIYRRKNGTLKQNE